MPSTFDLDLKIEIASSKRKRTYIFIFTLAVSFLYSVINLFISDYGLIFFFDNPGTYSFILIWHIVFIIYEFITLIFINKFINRGTGIPNSFILFNVFNEITFPSLLFVGVIYLEKKAILLDSPFMLIYFLIIILSALHLNFRVSVAIGFMTAVQYAAILIYTFFYLSGNPEYKVILPDSAYYSRIIILLLGGACAGFVGEEIKRRVMSSYSYLNDRREIEMLFNQQVSKEVVTALLKEKEQSRKAEVTIMFVDIRNFSSFAENSDPKEVIDFQNKIFSPLIDTINKYDGIVNQILGDGIMATFGAPIKNEEHTKNGFKAGLAILREIDVLIKNKIIPEIKVGIGLHTGEVITGNIGSDERKQYSISGSTVVIASRLEQLNKKYNSQYIISDDVYKIVKIDYANFENLGEESLKGIERKMNVYKVA